MKLLGSKILKINAERNPDFDGKLELKTNINIKSIEEYKPDTVKISSIKIDAIFEIKYGDLGKVEIEGQLFIGADDKEIKAVIKDYKRKKIDTPEQIAIMNLIIQKFSIKAFELEEELGLPIHIRLPTLQPKKE